MQSIYETCLLSTHQIRSQNKTKKKISLSVDHLTAKTACTNPSLASHTLPTQWCTAKTKQNTCYPHPSLSSHTLTPHTGAHNGCHTKPAPTSSSSVSQLEKARHNRSHNIGKASLCQLWHWLPAGVMKVGQGQVISVGLRLVAFCLSPDDCYYTHFLSLLCYQRGRVRNHQMPQQ